MRQILIILIIISSISSQAQLLHYNNFPNLNTTNSIDTISCLLDNKQDNISMCFSMRRLKKSYNGPLIKLRKSSDNSERNFYSHEDNPIIDKEAIDLWSQSSELYVVVWYDQSGYERHAIQDDISKQPKFTIDADTYYWAGDGIDDYLEINTSIQTLTHSGVEASIFCIIGASNKAQHTFGVLNGRDRWSAHINWSNKSLYFDPGICCNTSRSINNSINTGKLAQYTFIRTDSRVIIRINNSEKLNADHTTGRCTLDTNFTLGWAKGKEFKLLSTSHFCEFIMYNINISPDLYKNIEQEQLNFWDI